MAVLHLAVHDAQEVRWVEEEADSSSDDRSGGDQAWEEEVQVLTGSL